MPSFAFYYITYDYVGIAFIKYNKQIILLKSFSNFTKWKDDILQVNPSMWWFALNCCMCNVSCLKTTEVDTEEVHRNNFVTLCCLAKSLASQLCIFYPLEPQVTHMLHTYFGIIFFLDTVVRNSFLFDVAIEWDLKGKYFLSSWYGYFEFMNTHGLNIGICSPSM